MKLSKEQLLLLASLIFMVLLVTVSQEIVDLETLR